MPKKPIPNATRLRRLLNRNGLSDMHGQFYPQANAYNVVALVLKNVKLAPRVDVHQRRISIAVP